MKATQAGARCPSRATKRGSVKQARLLRNMCRHAIGDKRETSGSLDQQLPGREWGTLSRAGSHISKYRKGGTMKLQSKIATSVGLMLLLACVSFAQHVKTDYDHSANFGQYKTYTWEKVQTKDPLLVDRIKSGSFVWTF